MLRSSKIRIFVLLISISVLFSPPFRIGFGQETNTKYGELKIDGSYIEKLVLEDKDHKAVELENPGEIIKLPVGEYRLIQIYVTGGYSCGFRNSLTGSNLINIDENKQAEIKAGAPLKQKIEVIRQGKYLILNYKLLGIDGQNYIRTNLDKKPEFSVYRGNKLVGSGNFQYG